MERVESTRERETEMIEKLQITCKDRLIALWQTLSEGEKERVMFKRVTLDQNIPDIMNEKEMSETLTPKKEETTEKFVKRVVESIVTYIRKGGRRTLAQIVGTKLEFLLSTLNILDIKDLRIAELYDIPIRLLMGVIIAKLKESAESQPIEEITATWAKIDWQDQTRIGMEAIKYISDILAARDRLLATFKNNEANVIEFLWKRIGNTALRNYFRNFTESEQKNPDPVVKNKIVNIERFTEILRDVSNIWEREAIDVRNRMSKKNADSPKIDKGEKRKRGAEAEINQLDIKVRYCYNCWMSNHLVADCTAPKYEELSAEEKIKRQKRTREAKRKIEIEKKRKE